MRATTRSSLLLLLLVASVVCAPPAAAQIAPGDFLVSTRFSVLHVAYATGKVRSLATPVGTPWMAADNHDLLIATLTDPNIPNEILRYSPTGGVTTVWRPAPTPGPTWAVGCLGELDQDGTFLASRLDYAWPASELVRLLPNGSLRTLRSNALFVGPPWIEPDTGDWFAFRGNGVPAFNGLLHYPSRGTPTTIWTPGVRVSCAAYDSTTNTFAVCDTGNPTATLWRIDRTGRVQRSMAASFLTGMTFDQETGRLFVNSYSSFIHEMNPRTGVLVRTWRAPFSAFGSITIYGHRELAGRGPATPGSTYGIDVAMLRAPNSPYVAALSLTGLRPGLPLGGPHVAYLVPDALTRHTLTLGDIPGITTGLRGTLDATGRSTISINIPSQAARGVRIFVAVVALNANTPSGIDVTPPWAFSIR